MGLQGVPRLQENAFPWDPVVVLRGVAFSYGQGTPVHCNLGSEEGVPHDERGTRGCTIHLCRYMLTYKGVHVQGHLAHKRPHLP